MKKLEIIVYTGKSRTAVYSICNLKFNVRNERLVAFHNGSNEDYHFIIKKLANESVGEIERIGGNKKKYKTFSWKL